MWQHSLTQLYLRDIEVPATLLSDSYTFLKKCKIILPLLSTIYRVYECVIWIEIVTSSFEDNVLPQDTLGTIQRSRISSVILLKHSAKTRDHCGRLFTATRRNCARGHYRCVILNAAAALRRDERADRNTPAALDIDSARSTSDAGRSRSASLVPLFILSSSLKRSINSAPQLLLCRVLIYSQQRRWECHAVSISLPRRLSVRLCFVIKSTSHTNELITI